MKKIAVLLVFVLMLSLCACGMLSVGPEPTYLFKPGTTVNPDHFSSLSLEEMEDVIAGIEQFLADRKANELPESERSTLASQLKELNLMLEKEREREAAKVSPTP